MINVLIGHRGVGKTSLLNRIKTYFPEDCCIDLDQEVERKNSIADIFSQQGEESFRQIEIQTFANLIKSKLPTQRLWISLGAGFKLESLPSEINEVIWVRRKTDFLGRIFFDRPRLDNEKSALDEARYRFQIRDRLFAELSTFTYDLPEGLFEQDPIESMLLQGRADPQGGMVTLQKMKVSPLKASLLLNCECLEFRDDLTKTSFESAKGLAKKIIYSRRINRNIKYIENVGADFVDWPLEMGPRDTSAILSIHNRKSNQSLAEVIEILNSKAARQQHLKLAVNINDFTELRAGIEWQNKEPLRRSFLPRSVEGRWAWVRLWLKGRQWINFISDEGGSALDQPTWWEWLNTPDKSERFAAVLGDPVFHSRSPAMHNQFFKKARIPFWAINIKSEEWADALKLLDDMGLRAAAVTAPLKTFAGGNTLWKINSDWKVANTDIEGLMSLAGYVEESDRVMVWGGGGTLQTLKRVFPNGDFFSIRSGRDRQSQILPENKYDCVVWAAGPDANTPVFLPSNLGASNRKIKTVIDLNYREDSLAREFAISCGAKYIAGDKMFQVQGLAQQLIWKSIV